MKESMEEILDQCVDELRAGKPLEDVLRAYPDEATELRPLLNLTVELENLPAPEPTVRGLLRALARNAGEASAPGMRGGRLLPFPFPVFARIAAGIALLFTLAAGTTIASSNAAPGDWLYPVKRLSERVKFALTVDSENKAELRIIFSEARLADAVKKYARGEGLDENLLSAMLEEARRAIEEAGALPPVERARLLARAQSAGAYQTRVLSDLKTRAPNRDKEKLGRWAERCRRRWKWSCGLNSPPDVDESGGASTSAQWRKACRQSCPSW